MRRQRETWDVGRFAEVNLPSIAGAAEVIGNPRGVRVLDMPIHMPGVAGGLAIPPPLLPFIDIIAAALRYEGNFDPPLADMYVYVTVDQKEVKAGTTGRRPGAHADAYIASGDAQLDIIAENADAIAAERSIIGHTYVWCDSVPTEYFLVPFPLDDTTDSGSLRTFDEIADACSPNEIVTFNEKWLLKLTPYVIHRCAIAPSDVYRTFVKVSVSDRQFRREGNTRNPMFDYDWRMDKRSPADRNTPWATGGSA